MVASTKQATHHDATAKAWCGKWPWGQQTSYCVCVAPPWQGLVGYTNITTYQGDATHSYRDR